MCELSQLQLLNLSENEHLLDDGGGRLAQSPLNKVQSLVMELRPNILMLCAVHDAVILLSPCIGKDALCSCSLRLAVTWI